MTVKDILIFIIIVTHRIMGFSVRSEKYDKNSNFYLIIKIKVPTEDRGMKNKILKSRRDDN